MDNGFISYYFLVKNKGKNLRRRENQILITRYAVATFTKTFIFVKKTNGRPAQIT